MKDFLMIFVLLVVIYWYFNIRGKSKCITIVPEYTDIDYVESNKS